ncbi:oxidoreductase [Xylariomycetidae sp. FL0641]|nr:oxidoreductase [Xylariomycetidae sp. FL0641]
MTTERADLTSRQLPQITLGAGASSPLTAPPPAPDPHLGPADRAAARFHVGGTAIVTGGGGDLGSTVCRALLEHGVSRLCIFDVHPAPAQALAARLAGEFPGAGVSAEQVDVTDEAAVDGAVARVDARAGPVATLVCFHGVVACGHAVDFPGEAVRRVLDVNTVGTFLVARAVAKLSLLPRGARGSVVLVASVSAHRVNFPQPQVGYNVAKAGVVALTKSLAAEWGGRGVRVNCISPGYMDTILNEGEGLEEARRLWYSRHPLGRMGSPHEITGAVVLLASQAGSYFNGADLLMDGGQTLFM